MKKIIFCFFIIFILLFSCNTMKSTDSINDRIFEKTISAEIEEDFNVLIYTGLFGELKFINLMELMKEFETFCQDYDTEIFWNNVKILFPLYYEGSNIPPADMLFLSNSIMILMSRFFSNNFDVLENRFYEYSFNDNELLLKSIDSRRNISRWFDVEEYHMIHGNVLYVDRINKTVIYNYRNGFYYGGFLFYD